MCVRKKKLKKICITRIFGYKKGLDYRKINGFFYVAVGGNVGVMLVLLLLGSLVALSPCLPNIYGIYAERKVETRHCHVSTFSFHNRLCLCGQRTANLVQRIDLPHTPRTDRTKQSCF